MRVVQLIRWNPVADVYDGRIDNVRGYERWLVLLGPYGLLGGGRQLGLIGTHLTLFIILEFQY